MSANIGRNTLARSSANAVRCPSCRRMLRPPPGAPRFRCPCNQVLMAPTTSPTTTIPPPPAATLPRTSTTTTVTTTATPSQVKCPRCRATLIPPPGADTFRCPCGVALRAPTHNNTHSQLSANNNGNSLSSFLQDGGAHPALRSVRARIGRADMKDENSMEMLSPEQTAAQLRKPNEEHWVRNNKGVSLFWVRQPSEQQDKEMQVLMGGFEKDMKEKIDKMTLADLQLRVHQIGFGDRIVDPTNEEELRDLLKSAKEFILSSSAWTKVRVMRQLDSLQVEYSSCTDDEEYIEKLCAAVWYGPQRFSDGFVRSFVENTQLDMIPAQKFRLDVDFNRHKITADEIVRMGGKKFQEKVDWFRNKCAGEAIPWNAGRMQVKVKRHDLLESSFDIIFNVNPEELKKSLKVEFVGEDGIDAGGLSREWFELVTDACFNVDCGLFEYSGVDNLTYQINPVSGFANEFHLKYFRFLGRLIGKALFDHKFINAHLTRPLFKHICGFPITMSDIEYSDSRVYASLKEMEASSNVEDYLMTFTATLEVFGHSEEIDLKPGGGEIEVTNNNLQEYLNLMTKHYMFERTKVQLGHFLKGIYEVIPEVWLAIFDFRELELLLCGLPNINVADWKANTKYKGEYHQSHTVIKWFWEVVESSSHEQRAMILQYCTGTSRVPVQGFKALQGNDGNLKPFTIESVRASDYIYPRAHTCFNRIELPIYRSKQDLIKRFEEALKQGVTGFSDE